MEIDLKEEKGCEVSINNVTRFHSLFYSVGVNPKDYSSMAACATTIKGISFRALTVWCMWFVCPFWLMFNPFCG